MKQILLLAACCAALWASGTTAWELNTYQDFVRGRFEGVSLSRDGQLTLAPKVETVFSSDQPVIWSMAAGIDGVVYIATGHRGRVYRIDRSGASTLLWTAEQPEVFALAVDAKGVLYAGTSPDGKVYRIENGKATEYFAPKAKYIWALAASKDGSLYVGTGDQGKIYRVESAGKGEVYYDTGQAHITGLAIDQQGRLLAGSEPNGILYRISAKDKAFVLYDANLPEIRAIVPMTDGSIYVAALGGSIAKRAQSASQASQSGAGSGQVPSTTTTITVEANAQAGGEIKVQPEAPKQAAPSTPQVAAQFTPVVDMAGVEKSAVYRINPDNTVETLWSSKDENVYDLLALERQLLFSTDGNGRIYGLSRDRKVTLVLQTNEAEATRLLPSEKSVLAATGNMGRIYRLGEGPGASGSYESPVHDAGSPARWGSISWRAAMPASTTLRFRTRSGNSTRPDRTWSEWSDPVSDPAASRISSPNARYIQWKAEFTGQAGSTPTLDNVSVAYLPQNMPPVVKTINVLMTVSATPAGSAKGSQPSSTAAYSVTVTDTGDATPGPSSGTPTQTLSRSGTAQISISWQADDPDGDRLVYTLYFRGEGETQWKLMRGNLHENSFLLDGDVLADGKYYFRVVASDREANSPQAARSGDLVSAPVMIDNTPPQVTLGPVKKSAGKVEVEFEAYDAASPLRRCEYSLDAGTWTPLEAADGVIDSQREKFVIALDSVAPGEHVLVIRAVDSANNAGLAKIVLR